MFDPFVSPSPGISEPMFSDDPLVCEHEHEEPKEEPEMDFGWFGESDTEWMF